MPDLSFTLIELVIRREGLRKKLRSGVTFREKLQIRKKIKDLEKDIIKIKKWLPPVE